MPKKKGIIILRYKSCGSKNRVSNRFIGGKQSYKCKSCGKTYRSEYLREKYTIEKK